MKVKILNSVWDLGLGCVDHLVRAYVRSEVRLFSFSSSRNDESFGFYLNFVISTVPLTILNLPVIGLHQLSRPGNFRVLSFHLNQLMTVEAEEIWYALKSGMY